jgi:phosphate acetyltransferase
VIPPRPGPPVPGFDGDPDRARGAVPYRLGFGTVGSVSRSVYLTAMGPASGKSLVALGLMELLSRRVSRIGFFRPLITSAPDADIELIRQRYHLPPERVGYAFTDDSYHGSGAASRAGAAAGMAFAVDRYKDVERECDLVVIEGSDFTGPTQPVELEVNIQLARNIGAPLLAVVDGGDRPVDEVEEGVRLSVESLRDLTVLGIIVNRVAPDAVDDVVAAFRGERALQAPVWAIPEQPLLRQPSLERIADVVGARRISGSYDDVHRSVQSIKVAAMSVPNLLDRVSERTLLITPGDRVDVMLAAALACQRPGPAAVAGLLLTGGLVPDDRVLDLVLGAGGSDPLPMFSVETDTMETALAVAEVEGRLAPESRRKIETGLALFEDHVDIATLAERIQLARSEVVTPVMFQYDLIERARAADAHIVLPEGTDDRILRAADRLRRRKVCELTLLGDPDQVGGRISALGLDLHDVPIVDPVHSDLLDRFAERYAELRAHKGVTLDRAHDVMTDLSYFGTMMVQEGLVDGMVSGAAHTTAHTIRPALEFVKTREGVSIVSSCFLMLLADRVLVYGDCAINPDPDADELADIAVSSAETAALFGIEPRVAMLSYSTGQSGAGADVDKVRAATERVRELRPDLLVEGPIQYDAAIDADVARSKLPDSQVAGNATVFIFPDLNTGNNTYKAVQRSANAVAVGPVLQGLNRPVNDLSRGALVEDIVNTVAITAVQTVSAGAPTAERTER